MGRDTIKRPVSLYFEVTSDLAGHYACRITSL
jgi:hypothetical protein